MFFFREILLFFLVKNDEIVICFVLLGVVFVRLFFVLDWVEIFLEWVFFILEYLELMVEFFVCVEGLFFLLFLDCCWFNFCLGFFLFNIFFVSLFRLVILIVILNGFFFKFGFWGVIFLFKLLLVIEVVFNLLGIVGIFLFGCCLFNLFSFW